MVISNNIIAGKILFHCNLLIGFWKSFSVSFFFFFLLEKQRNKQTFKVEITWQCMWFFRTYCNPLVIYLTYLSTFWRVSTKDNFEMSVGCNYDDKNNFFLTNRLSIKCYTIQYYRKSLSLGFKNVLCFHLNEIFNLWNCYKYSK